MNNVHTEKLPGSWNVGVTMPGVGLFPALMTFTSDGSVIADESPNAFESTGHGSWVSIGPGAAAYTFVALFGSQEWRNTGNSRLSASCSTKRMPILGMVSSKLMSLMPVEK